MSASGVGSKYHCSLNGVGYLLTPSGYSKRDGQIFAPRFNTGEQGLSDLDLFRTIDQTDMSVGGFQRVLDPQNPKMSLVKNMIYNPYDRLLYTVPTATASAITGNSKSQGYKGAVYKSVLYYIKNIAANGRVFKYNPATKTETSVKADFATQCSDIFVHNNLLFVYTTTGLVWTYDGTTWTSDARFGFNLGCPLRGNIVSADANAAGLAGKLWLRDGTAGSTAVVSAIGNAGDINIAPNSMVNYNSRVYIGKPDGLFVYDGVQIANVVDNSLDFDPKNYQFMATLAGVLYFVYKNAVWSFNGASISLVQDFSQYETITHMTTQAGRLWVTTHVVTAFSDQFAANNANYYCFDTRGWFLYYTVSTGQDYGGVLFCNDGTYQHLLFATFQLASTYAATYDVIDKAQEFLASSSQVGTIYTPQMDANFPNVDKYLDSVQTNFEKMITNDSIQVQFKVNTSVGDSTQGAPVMAPGTVADDATVGTLAWSNVNNIKVDDGAVADCSIFGNPQGYLAPTRTPSTDSPGETDATNPTQAYSEDATYASLTQVAAGPGGDKKQSYGDFGIVIPTGATIVGVEVKIKGWSFNTGGQMNVFLRNGGADKDITFTNNNAWYTLGGPTDLWGISWVASNFTNANFTVNLETFTINQFLIDAIQVKIYYTPLSVTDNVVKLVKGGVISGNDKANTSVVYPAIGSPVNSDYGGSADLWGLALTPGDINAANFGVVFSSKNSSLTSHYLKATNFGFAIPGAATILGVTVRVKKSMLGIDYIVITVTYSLSGDTWFTLGTLTSASLSRRLALYLTAYNAVFRSVQLKFIVTRSAASSLGFKDYAMNYYLSPDQQWQWVLRLICTSTTETPLMLLDDSRETLSAAELRDNIYQARWTDAPVGYEDIDFTKANGAVLIGGDITVTSTKGFRNSGFIKIDSEIIQYTGKTSTSFTGCTRGALQTIAATHLDQAIVNAYYRVVIKSIDNEILAGDPTVPNQLSTGQETYVALTLMEAPSSG